MEEAAEEVVEAEGAWGPTRQSATFAATASRPTSRLRISGPEEIRIHLEAYARRPAGAVAYPIINEARASDMGPTAGQLSTLAGIKEPRGVEWDPFRSQLLVATECRVVAVDKFGFLRNVAGTGECGFSGDGASALSAQLDHPVGLLLWGKLYIADSGNDRIRVVDLDQGTIDTLAGGGTAGAPDFGDGVEPRAATFDAPSWLLYIGGTTARSGLLVGDTGHDRLRFISLEEDAPYVETWVRPDASCEQEVAFRGCGGPLGCSLAKVGYDNTTRLPTILMSAELCGATPGGQTPGILRVDEPSNWQAVHWAAGYAQGSPDAIAAQRLRFGAPPLLSHQDRWLAAADPVGNRVYLINPHSTEVTTSAGDGVAESTGDWAVATSARVNRPTGLHFWSEELFISEAGAHAVRGLLDVVSPTEQPQRMALSVVGGSGENVLPMQPTTPVTVRVHPVNAADQSIPGVGLLWRAESYWPCALEADRSFADANGLSSMGVRPGLASCSAQARFLNFHASRLFIVDQGNTTVRFTER